jgi:protein-tyrosine-phosphatase
MTEAAVEYISNMGTDELHSATQAALVNLPVDVDPAPLTNLFFSFKGALGELADRAQLHEVNSASTCAQATEMVAQLKKLSSAIEKRRKVIVAPYTRITKEVNRPCKELQDHIKRILGFLDRRQTAYLEEEEQKRQEAAAAVPQMEPGDTTVDFIAPAPKVETEIGRTRLKTNVEWAITDPALIVVEAWNTRHKQIEAAVAPYINDLIKKGTEKIPGVEILEVKKAKTTVRR